MLMVLDVHEALSGPSTEFRMARFQFFIVCNVESGGILNVDVSTSNSFETQDLN